jgi:hypothetical protein
VALLCFSLPKSQDAFPHELPKLPLWPSPPPSVFEGGGGRRFFERRIAIKKAKTKKGVMGMNEATKQEKKPEGSQTEEQEAQGWKVSDEEIDRVIRKLEEGWSF